MSARARVFAFLMIACSPAVSRAGAAIDPDSLYFHAHPRLAFTASDVPALQQKLRDGGADDDALETLRSYVTGDYPNTSFANLLDITFGMDVTLNCGLVAFLDTPANAAAMDFGHAFTVALADSFAADDDPFFTSTRLRILCYGYDLCMHDATPAERSYVRDEIETYVDSLMYAFNFERWLHPPYTSNKTAMTGAALGIAAICLADEMEPARVTAALARADQFVDTWIRYHLDPDGSCFEGVQYGAWAMRHLAWYFEARRRYDGVDYAQRGDIRRVEQWFAYETLPESGGVVNNLNDTAYLNHPLAGINTYIDWATGRWNSGVASWLWDRMLGSEDGYDWGPRTDHAATALWYRPAAPVNPGAVLPRSFLWKERGLYYFRTGWQSHGSSDDVVFSFYDGRFHGGHSQEDQGNFTLYAAGTRFAADNGFDPPNARSDAHNMVYVDGKGQHYSGGSVGTDGRMRAHVLTPYADYLFGDATAAYGTHSPYNDPGVPFPDDDWSPGYLNANPVERAYREWIVVHDGDTPPYFVLLDDVQKDEAPRSYQWRMHTDAANAVDITANPIRVDGPRGDMTIDVVHPSFDALSRVVSPFHNTSVDPDTRVITLTSTRERGVFAMVLRALRPGETHPNTETLTYPWGGFEVMAWPGGIIDVLVAHAGTDTVEVTPSLHNGSGERLPIRTDARLLHVRRRSGQADKLIIIQAKMCDIGGTPVLRAENGSATVIVAGDRAYVDEPGARFRLRAPGVRTLEAAGTELTFARDGAFIVRSDFTAKTPPAAPALRVFPMPASQSATIVVDAAGSGAASVTIFDVAGRRVRSLWNGPLSKGEHFIGFDGRDDMARRLSSGVYFARVFQNGHTASAKIVWVR